MIRAVPRLYGLAVLASFLAQAQHVTGDWLGTLHVGPAELRLVLHIARGDSGGLKATMDSIDQANSDSIPLDAISFADSKLSFTASSIHGSYTGTVNADATAIRGTWTQNQSFPLDFK